MEATAPPIQDRPLLSPRLARTTSIWDWGAAWLIAFALTTYLALSGGGYDIVVRGEIGLLVWWLLLLGLIVGVLPRMGLGRASWVALIPLTGFFAWTWIATNWTSDQELTLVEVARVATYIGVFVLGASLIRRGSARGLLYGAATGIAVVCALAVLSKLVPSLFPHNPTAKFYATIRLGYPFDYSDGVGEFAALGIPLLLYVASSALTVWARALGGAALPVVLLCLGMTVSRGGILATGVGLVVFFALSPDRLPRLASAAIAGAATVVLMLALLSRKGLTDQLYGAAPAGQRHSMLAIVVIVAVVAGLVQGAVALAGRRGLRPGWTRFDSRAARVVGLVIAVVVIAGLVGFFASGTGHRAWEQFKQPNPVASTNTYKRLLSVAGSHRYQYWTVALHAFDSSRWEGIGPGTFQFYWAQHQRLGEYVLNAHSLWIETLAELGIVGLALLVMFFAWVLLRGSTRALRSPLEDRALRVAAVAAVAAFCAAAAFDWVWQIGVVPIVAMLMCAVCLAEPSRAHPQTPTGSAGSALRLPARLLLIAGALAALWAIIIPLGTTMAVRNSQSAAQRGLVGTALRDAANAQRLEPGAASPRLQRALLLEQQNAIQGAAQAIAQAKQRAPNDWQIWLVASRIATEQNRPRQALADYRRARSLNPRSPIFGG